MGEGKTRGGTLEVFCTQTETPLPLAPAVSLCSPSPGAGCSGLSPPAHVHRGTSSVFSPMQGTTLGRRLTFPFLSTSAVRRGGGAGRSEVTQAAVAGTLPTGLEALVLPPNPTSVWHLGHF